MIGTARVASLKETQLRLEYTLLRLAIRVAAQFHLPMRTLAELTRLSYAEVLKESGEKQTAIARRMGQTDRHLRSLSQRLRTDFFAAEQEPGVVRELESLVAARQPLVEDELRGLLPNVTFAEIDYGLKVLMREQRIERREDGRFVLGQRFAALTSDQFKHRLEGLNQFVDVAYQAIARRLLRDDPLSAALDTMTFQADPAVVPAFLSRLEQKLRDELRELEEQSKASGGASKRYSLAFAVAATNEE